MFFQLFFPHIWNFQIMDGHGLEQGGVIKEFFLK